MPSAARLLATPAAAAPAIRSALVAKLGRIRSRSRGHDGAREFYLDFRPIGRVWSNRGIRISDEGTARRLLEKIREQVAEGVSVEEVLARYQPIGATANLMPTWLSRWIELRRREMSAGSLSPNFVRELERLAAPGGQISFFDRISIHEVTYGRLEDWSIWLADRKQSPKSRRNFLGYMRSFLRWLELRGEIAKAPRVPPVRVEEYEPRILSITDQDTVLAHIPDEDRGIFLALAHLGLRPGEARALTVADYRDGWLFVDKAAKSKAAGAEIRGTKTGKPKRLPGERGTRGLDRAARRSRSSLQRCASLPQSAHRPDVAAQGAPARLESGTRRGRAAARHALRGHETHNGDGRDPPGCSGARAATLPGPRLGAVDAPLRPPRRPCADRSAAARKDELATSWRQALRDQTEARSTS